MPHRDTILAPGVVAPPIDLPLSPTEKWSLAAQRGKPVVLAFYPADFSPVCSDQMALYSALMPEFRELGAEVVGISVDGPWCHAAFAEARSLGVTLLSDFEPKGAVARKYGAYDAYEGTSKRALFVIGPDGVIAWSYLSPDGVNPGADGILAALERITGRTAGEVTF